MSESNLMMVSACLAGINCKYSGGNNVDERIAFLVEEGKAIPLCPEVLGALPIPRTPCEQIKELSGKICVVTESGMDLTEQFTTGAEITLAMCQAAGITKAILQQRSPSCGKGKIYDGTFTGQLIEGDGLTTKLFEANGIEVMTIDNL